MECRLQRITLHCYKYTVRPGHELQQRSSRQSPTYTDRKSLVVHLHFAVVVNIHLNDDAVENDSDGRLINNMIRTGLVLGLGRPWLAPGSWLGSVRLGREERADQLTGRQRRSGDSDQDD